MPTNGGQSDEFWNLVRDNHQESLRRLIRIEDESKRNTQVLNENTVSLSKIEARVEKISEIEIRLDKVDERVNKIERKITMAQGVWFGLTITGSFIGAGVRIVWDLIFPHAK